MEPLLPSTGCVELEDRALDLVAASNRLAGKLTGQVREAIGDLVRSMNCYYSNLIEGHNTHPRDIDQALRDNFHADAKRRVLQYEARAHIELQRMIDAGLDPQIAPTSKDYLLWLHGEFCSQLPDELLWVENPKSGERVSIEPGAFRSREVHVGHHEPPLADELPEFLGRFEQAYSRPQSKAMSIVAAAAAHHRVLWIHPFIDGNGRVARLMSHAMLLRCGVGSSLWSVARGLARRVGDYKAGLMAADQTRYNDLDGRGALSEKRLVEFCNFFLDTAVDQVEFMGSLVEPSELLRRMKLYVDDEVDAGRLPRGSLALLREAFVAGELARGRAAELTGYQERRGRQILAKLISRRLLVAQGPRQPVRLGFPPEAAERLFPNLYPIGSS